MSLTTNTFKLPFAAILMTGAVIASSQSAEAFSISNTVPGSSTIIDFESFGNPLPGNVNGYTSGIATYSTSNSTDGIVVQGDDLTEPNPRYRAPSLGATGQYLSIGSYGDSSAETTINFARTLDFFGLLWGSIDSYNEIEFFLDGTSKGLFTGTSVASALGLAVDVDNESFVGFTASNSTEYFNRVVLRSLSGGVGISPIAFENDNHTYRAIPTPALLPGLIGLGAAAWRKRKQETTQDA